MKATDLRDLNDKALREHIATQRRDLFGLRSGKRALARALTVARQRGIDPNQKIADNG